jgi:chromosomal replication initiator protein
MRTWEQLLLQLEADIGRETVDKWLRSLKVLRFDACNLYLEAKDSFQALWFEEHIRSKIKTSFVNGNHRQIKIHLTIANSSSIPSKKRTKEKREASIPFQLVFDELNPILLLDSFVFSSDNEMTHKFLNELSCLSETGPTRLGTFNPIYFYGLSGSGKTHLLMSLADTFQKRGLKTLFVRAETFTNHVVSAIRAGEMSLFRQAYRNTDVLLVDDIHQFSRKGATQEEFFHTFNTLHLEGKQIILSANCPPQELQLIESRLVSRFEWGIILPLKTVSDNDLAPLLQAKAKALNFLLPMKIADFLTDIFKANTHTLVKALEALVLRLHLDKEHSIHHLTVPSVKILLADLLAEAQKATLSPDQIVQAVAEHYGIKAEDIKGKGQTKEFVLPRQMAMHFCREKLKMTFIKIGTFFSRDHSTVMASVKYIQKALEEENRTVVPAWQSIMKKCFS